MNEMITFPNGAKATVAVTIGIGVARALLFFAVIAVCRQFAWWTGLIGGVAVTWGAPLLEGYVLHRILVATGMMFCPGCPAHTRRSDYG